jgi:hypothetical protein
MKEIQLHCSYPRSIIKLTDKIHKLDVFSGKGNRQSTQYKISGILAFNVTWNCTMEFSTNSYFWYHIKFD